MNLIANLVSLAFTVYTLGLFVYVAQSWVGVRFDPSFDQLLRNAYDPFLGAIRSKVRPVRLGHVQFDASPFILVFGIFLARAMLLTLILWPGL
ncbi:MAG: YggT family protein [Verrucomicrobia bacterium]|nr:YggT family protein [Verrucomicrobiota bacterium]MCH8510968.1 YggT family protein [Kiritimatiellia bacterium]